MPFINVFIQLVNRLLLDLEGSNVFILNSFYTFQNVFHPHFVLFSFVSRERTLQKIMDSQMAAQFQLPSCLERISSDLVMRLNHVLTPDTIYDEIIRKLRNGGSKVYIGYWFKFVCHGDIVNPSDLTFEIINKLYEIHKVPLTYKGGAKAILNPVAQIKMSTLWRVPLSSIIPSGTTLTISL